MPPHREIAQQVIQSDELAHLRLMERTVGHMRGYVMIVEHTNSDQQYVIRYVNEAFTELTGYRPADVYGRNPMLLLGPNSDVGLLKEKLAEVAEGRAVLFDLLHYRKDGQSVVLDTSIFPLLGADQTVQYTISIGRDTTERRAKERAADRAEVAEQNIEALRGEIADRKRAEGQLAQAVLHDALTGLPNRILLTERATVALARGRRESGVVAALFVDCDNLKMVNDTLGHAAGDRYLIAVARRLAEHTRPGDIVARIGGDEFAMLLEDVADENAATAIAERISKECSARAFQLGDHEVSGTVSIGIAFSSPSCRTSEELLRDADIAMYRAKVLGKNRCQTFAVEMRDEAARLLKIQIAMRQAFDSGGLSIAYQPIVSLGDGSINGFEALARWRDPELGEISPTEFIPAAEETGLIVPLGLIMLRNACAQAARWREQFPALPALSMSINVSVKQLIQEEFVEQVRRALHSTGLPASNLQLEITESTLMHEPDRVGFALAGLRRLGVKLGIDDFGTGYSSLARLAEFPINILKIDRTFVSTGGSRGLASPEIVQTVLSLAQHLGLGVIAEGVENEQQAKELRDLGCTLAQGYYFATPLDRRAGTAFLRRATATIDQPPTAMMLAMNAA
jgi:diguanylate cyclase (GGDEF)-like protein/PAS domain S-box-containing protein